jgi:hypothetical protein
MLAIAEFYNVSCFYHKRYKNSYRIQENMNSFPFNISDEINLPEQMDFSSITSSS